VRRPLLGGLAEYERELIRARTGEGRARAVANGVKMGRRPKHTHHQQPEAINRRDHGEETLAEIGRSYNVIGWAALERDPFGLNRITPGSMRS
jgi:DNA invertase Pin-like site-specific DNA recombinase